MPNRLTAAVAACLLALGLGGCNTTGMPPVTNPIALPSAVQAAAVKICGYAPSAFSVANILATYSGNNTVAGITELVTQVASDICASVVPAKGMHRRGARMSGYVHGVRVDGYFVRQPR